MHDFRRLLVWQQSRVLATDLYTRTRRFAPGDRGVIGLQLRRSALSIPANIAEGCGKDTRAETVRFLKIALGSAAETEHHVTIAEDVGLLAREEARDYANRSVAVQRMLSALIHTLPGR